MDYANINGTSNKVAEHKRRLGNALFRHASKRNGQGEAEIKKGNAAAGTALKADALALSKGALLAYKEANLWTNNVEVSNDIAESAAGSAFWSKGMPSARPQLLAVSVDSFEHSLELCHDKADAAKVAHSVEMVQTFVASQHDPAVEQTFQKLHDEALKLEETLPGTLPAADK